MTDKKDSIQNDGLPDTPVDKPVMPDRTKMASALRALAKIGAFVVAFMGVAIAGLFLYVWHHGGMKSLAETMLSRPEMGLQTSVASAELFLFEQGLSARLQLNDVTGALSDQKLIIPQISLTSSAELVLSGKFWQVTAQKLSLELVQADQGLSLAGEWQTWQNAMEKAAVSDQPDRGVLALLAGRSFAIADSQIILRQKNKPDILTVTNLAGSLDVDNQQGISVTATAHINSARDGADGNSISLKGTANLLSGLAEIDLSASDVPFAELSPFLSNDMQNAGDLGLVDASLALTLDGQIIQTASGRILAREGYVVIGNQANKFDSLTSAISYSFVDDYVVLKDMALALPDQRKLQFAGDIAGLSQPTPSFNGTLLLEDVAIETLLAQWPTEALPAVRSYMIESFSGGALQTLSATFDGRFDKAAKAISLSSLSLNGEVNQVRVATGYGQYAQFVGTAKGRMALEVMAGGALKSASVKLDISDGYIATDDNPTIRTFSKASGEIRYTTGMVHVPDLAIAFKDDGALSSELVMKISEDRQIQSVDMTLLSDALSVDVITQLFPRGLSEPTYDFLNNNVKEGWVRDLSLSAQLARDNTTDVMINNGFDVAARLDGPQFIWLADQDPIQDIKADLLLQDNQLTLVVDQADHPLFALDKARVTYGPLRLESDHRDLSVMADGQADLSDILPILASPEIAVLESLPVSLTDASGEARFVLAMKGHQDQGQPMRIQLDHLDASISQASATDFYAGYDIKDADLVLEVTQDAFEATGQVTVDDVVTDFTLMQSEDTITITGQAAPQEVLTSHITALIEQDVMGQDITGALGGKYKVDITNNGNDISAFLSADLTKIGLDVPLLNWAKLPSDSGVASAVLRFAEGHLRQINNISLSAGGLQAYGDVRFAEQGQFEGAYFYDVHWPGTTISTLLVEHQTTNGLSVIAEGPLIDLRQFRQNSGTAGQSLDLQFDITSEQVMIENDVTLFGQLSGYLHNSGNGEAKLQGALLIDGDVLLDEGTINANFGSDGEYLSAVGLIGGAEARLEFSPRETGGGILIIQSKNAGRTLSGLDITDAIRSGRLVLVSDFADNSFTEFDTTIQLEEFNVIEAPAAIRAFSVLGLAGLYSLVEGDGTKFTTGEAEIQTKGNTHLIPKMSAQGGAVGVELVGRYDSATRQVDVSGNITPVNQFSKIIGAVPLLGSVLSGIDKAGIFATQFNITGKIDDPETSVNAASVLPGVVRNILSPDWLGDEKDRILGPQARQLSAE